MSRGLLVLVSISLMACDSGSYDDCVLEGIEGRSSEAGIETVKESCLRKYEEGQDGPLSVQKTSPRDGLFGEDNEVAQIQVSNDSDLIVTQFSLKTAAGKEWTYNAWIEPGRWAEFDSPTADDPSFEKQLDEGKVTARYIKGIPSK